MVRKTLYGVKKEKIVDTDGIYVKNIEEVNSGNKSDIKFHQEAENTTKEILSCFNLKKDGSSELAIDLIGDLHLFIEVERDFATEKWTNKSNFPYNLINIPAEKKRHFLEHRKSSFYLKYNKELNCFLILYGEDILNESNEENLLANHSGQKAERTFLRIPKSFALFSDLSSLDETKLFILKKLNGDN